MYVCVYSLFFFVLLVSEYDYYPGSCSFAYVMIKPPPRHKFALGLDVG